MMINITAAYEPRYYERSAQRYITRHLQARILINVPWGLCGSPTSRPEIDAVTILDDRITPIEIKAYSLDTSNVEKLSQSTESLAFAD